MSATRDNSADLQPRYRKGLHAYGPVVLQQGVNHEEVVQTTEDFIGDAGQSLPTGFVGTKTGVSTNNTIDYAGGGPGVYELTHSGDSEAQTMRVDSGDTLWVGAGAQPIFRCRFKLTLAGATLSADQRLVVGLAAAYNATLDDVASHVWFRVEGADNEILVEGDDGTTDTDDQSTGVDLVDDTWTTVEIDASSLAAVKFFIDGVSVGEVDVSELTASSYLQPLVCIQRDDGAEEETLAIDYIDVVQRRDPATSRPE